MTYIFNEGHDLLLSEGPVNHVTSSKSGRSPWVIWHFPALYYKRFWKCQITQTGALSAHRNIVLNWRRKKTSPLIRRTGIFQQKWKILWHSVFCACVYWPTARGRQPAREAWRHLRLGGRNACGRCTLRHFTPKRATCSSSTAREGAIWRTTCTSSGEPPSGRGQRSLKLNVPSDREGSTGASPCWKGACTTFTCRWPFSSPVPSLARGRRARLWL